MAYMSIIYVYPVYHQHRQHRGDGSDQTRPRDYTARKFILLLLSDNVDVSYLLS